MAIAQSAQTPVALSERIAPGIVQITLNRPSARNALNMALIERLLDQLSALSEDRSIRALIITGAGDLAFCAGADLHERRDMDATQRQAHTEAINALADAIALFPVPVIAAIRGYALAGGTELAVACDIRVAGDNAVFGLPEVKIGIFPGAGGLARLPGIRAGIKRCFAASLLTMT